VPTLAARANLGERNFYRRFLAATGSSPAHFVEALRLEAARTLIDGELPLKGVAAKVGLTPIRLNNAFERRFGVAPRLFRDMHGTAKRRVPIGSVDRMADHGGEFTHQTIGHLSGHRELAVALEFRDRGLGVRTDGAGRLQLAVAIFGERALHRRYAARAGGLRGNPGSTPAAASRSRARRPRRWSAWPPDWPRWQPTLAPYWSI
jgi:Transcriptional regulator containing an amidase domain and an AraC-type DNA-binding HTH domain